MFDYMGAFLFCSGFAHVDNVITKRRSKTITWLLLSRLQGNKPHRNSPEPSETLELSGTLRNLPEVASGTYTSTQRNLPEPASGTYTSTRRNSPEPFGETCLQNLHQQTSQLSGTLRNLPPEPTPAQNLLEPSSGTCSCDPHRHTPELIWAEDPISLRCWGKICIFFRKLNGFCLTMGYTQGVNFGFSLKTMCLLLPLIGNNIDAHQSYNNSSLVVEAIIVLTILHVNA